ncbi:MAG: VOC family protein [Bacteroidia bacterium]|nr:VOC family protein [Bacteroidia bacterium]
MNPFRNSALTTILVVSQIDASKKFYVNALGAEVFREYGGDSVVLKFLGNWILLVTSGNPTADKPDTTFLPPQTPNQVSHSFTIRVEGCKESYEELKARGVEFITSPYDWGLEVRCFFRDPDGHLFEISQYKG